MQLSPQTNRAVGYSNKIFLYIDQMDPRRLDYNKILACGEMCCTLTMALKEDFISSTSLQSGYLIDILKVELILLRGIL